MWIAYIQNSYLEFCPTRYCQVGHAIDGPSDLFK